MPIKRVSIKNYQSHKHTALNFHPGVNVIIGLSDSGKSALFRALQWPITNKNSDRGFRSNWGGKTDVELVFTDGKAISRTQNDKDPRNAYYLYDSENNIDEEYVAFKTDIPEDIVQALNLSEINIQSQFDPPYLLATSSGDVAKTLNKIANLEDIDTAISNIRKRILANSRNITNTEEHIANLEQNYAKFAYLPQMEEDVVELENLMYDEKQVIDKYVNLDMLVMKITNTQKEQNEINAFLKAEEPLQAALTLTEQLKPLQLKLNSINALIVIANECTDSLNELDSLLQAETELKTAMNKLDEITNLNTQINKLNYLIGQIRQMEWKKQTVTKDIEDYETEFNKLMPEHCPLCGR